MFADPTFLVQHGFQGKNRIIYGIEDDYIDGAILSPSDYIPNSNKEIATKLTDNDKIVLFDPQFYLPGQGDREKLNDYDYYDNFGGEDYSASLVYDDSLQEGFFNYLMDYQDKLDCSGYISPTGYISSISDEEIDDWFQLSDSFLSRAKERDPDKPVFITLAVNGEHLTNQSMRNSLLNRATELDTDGFYVSVQFDDDDLPLKGEKRVESYLRFLISLKLNRYEVIAAHTHQISHILYALGVNAVSSGHFNNLRSFDVKRWIVPDEPQPRQRVTRYYSDELLLSIRPDHLLTELAEETSFDLDKIRTDSQYADDLFGPSGSVNEGWPESEGEWDHYLTACKKIAEQYEDKNLDERVAHARDKVRRARALTKQIQNEIDEYVDELDQQFYDDWDNTLSEITDSKEYLRLKRMI